MFNSMKSYDQKNHPKSSINSTEPENMSENAVTFRQS
jgi:hypothetical protein